MRCVRIWFQDDLLHKAETGMQLTPCRLGRSTPYACTRVLRFLDNRSPLERLCVMSESGSGCRERPQMLMTQYDGRVRFELASPDVVEMRPLISVKAEREQI
jgi:hypothetical protein